DVIVAAVQAPYPSIRVARRVVCPEEKAAGRDGLKGVGAGGLELEIEVVEGTLVAITGLPREPVGDGEICGPFVLSNAAREARRVRQRVQARAEFEPREDGRGSAREHVVKPVAEDEAVEAGGR